MSISVIFANTMHEVITLTRLFRTKCIAFSAHNNCTTRNTMTNAFRPRQNREQRWSTSTTSDPSLQMLILGKSQLKELIKHSMTVDTADFLL